MVQLTCSAAEHLAAVPRTSRQSVYASLGWYASDVACGLGASAASATSAEDVTSRLQSDGSRSAVCL